VNLSLPDVLPAVTFIIGETEYRNQHGEVVAYTRNTAIETADAVKE
jgi:hypothetical protein